MCRVFKHIVYAKNWPQLYPSSASRQQWGQSERLAQGAIWSQLTLSSKLYTKYSKLTDASKEISKWEKVNAHNSKWAIIMGLKNLGLLKPYLFLFSFPLGNTFEIYKYTKHPSMTSFWGESLHLCYLKNAFSLIWWWLFIFMIPFL